MSDGFAGGEGAFPAPADLQATAVADTPVSLSWGAVAHASGFSVHRDGAGATSSSVPLASFTDAGRSPGRTYSYTVKAIDSSGAEGAASSPLDVTTTGTTTIPAPTNVKIDAVGATSVTLSWTAPADATGFDVFRAGH